MVINETIYEKYINLRENLAELLLLKEEIISIKNDSLLEDEKKFRLLYKKNMENLLKIQKKLEKDVMNLFRANEIYKYLEFSNNFIHVGQVHKIINLENNESRRFNVNDVDNFIELFDEINISENKNCNDVFKHIAKEISPLINSYNFNSELWDETLYAKSEDNKVVMDEIFKKIKDEKLIKKSNKFNIDDYLESVNILEKNLKFLEIDIRNILENYRDSVSEKKLNKMLKLLKKVENKKLEIIHSIEILTKIRNGLIDGFIASLPSNKNGMLN